MLTQLIATRPTQDRSAHGTALSLTLHAAILTLAIVAGARTDPVVYTDSASRVIEMSAFRPERPAPAAPARTAPTPRAEPTAPQPATPEIPLPTTTEVPSTIPVPSDEPWTPGAPSAPSGETGTGEAVEPAIGLPGGVFGESEVDVPAALLPRSPLPRYPDLLKPMRLEGGVRVRFILGTDGRVELSSVQFVESTHPAFVDAVRAVLPRMRFRPARANGRAVRQLVEFPIGFRLADR